MVTVEWEVAWFPHNRGDQTRTMVSETEARRLFRRMKTAGYAPILSKRTVTVTAWEIVENSVSSTI